MRCNTEEVPAPPYLHNSTIIQGIIAVLEFVFVALPIALLIAILIVLLAILAAVKTGFNEVIKGLEAVSDRLERPR